MSIYMSPGGTPLVKITEMVVCNLMLEKVLKIQSVISLWLSVQTKATCITLYGLLMFGKMFNVTDNT